MADTVRAEATQTPTAGVVAGPTPIEPVAATREPADGILACDTRCVYVDAVAAATGS